MRIKMITMCNFVIIICNFAPRPIADFYSFAGLLRVALGRAALWCAVSCAVAAAEIRFCAGAVCARLPLRPVRTGVRTGGCFLGKPGSGGEARSREFGVILKNIKKSIKKLIKPLRGSILMFIFAAKF